MSALRGILVVLVAGVFGLLGMGVASASPYPPGTCGQVSVSTTAPNIHASIVVTGTGFAAGDKLTIQLDSAANVLGHVTTDSDGSFSTTITLPAGVTGSHQLIVVADTTTCTAVPINLSIHQAAAGGVTTGGGGLASTGARIALGIGAGVVLIVAGGLSIFIGRRRHHGAHTA